VRKILKEVATEYGTTVGEMLAGGSFHPMPKARARAAWRLRHELSKTPPLNRIAAWLDVHHTTVIDMLRRYQKQEQADPVFGYAAAEDQIPYNPNEPDTSGEWAI
jgi:hypothetical protein